MKTQKETAERQSLFVYDTFISILYKKDSVFLEDKLIEKYRYFGIIILVTPIQKIACYKRKEVIFIMLDASYYRKTDEIISHYVRDARSLIPIMQDIQAEYRYLPAELLTYVAKEIGITEAKAYSVATFYENFSLEPKGKYVIKICDGTACHVRKSIPILEHFRKELGLTNEKHTSDDGLFTVETVSCLGACGLAPAIVVNDHVHPTMTVEKAQAIIDELRGEENA